MEIKNSLIKNAAMICMGLSVQTAQCLCHSSGQDWHRGSSSTEGASQYVKPLCAAKVRSQLKSLRTRCALDKEERTHIN